MMIAAYMGTSLFPSRIIEWFSWSPYSHVSLVYDDGREIEAWSKGGVQRLASWGINHNPGTIVDFFEYKLPLSSSEIDAGERFLNKQVGKKYDWMGVLRFLRRPDGTREDQKAWFCSEKVHAWSIALDPTGYRTLLSRIPSYKVMPGMVTISPLLRKVYTSRVPKR